MLGEVLLTILVLFLVGSALIYLTDRARRLKNVARSDRS